MQRVAALYDIHGNLPALEAVLEEVRREGVDAIVVGGDVLPGPMPRECLDLLHSTGIRTEFIHGNGESAVLESLRGGELTAVPEAFREGIRWNGTQLPNERSGRHLDLAADHAPRRGRNRQGSLLSRDSSE